MENCKRTQELVDKKAEEIKATEQTKKKLQKSLQAMKTAEVDIEHEMDQLKAEQKGHQADKKQILKQIETTKKAAAATFEEEEVPEIPSEDELSSMDLDEIQKQAVALEEAMADMKVDLNSIAEYKTKEEDYKPFNVLPSHNAGKRNLPTLDGASKRPRSCEWESTLRRVGRARSCAW